MASQVIVLLAEPVAGLQCTGGPGTHRTVMVAHSFHESSRSPTLHPSRRHGNPVDAATPYRHVTADLLEALAPKDLARPGDVFDTSEAVVVRQTFFDERCSGDAELGILSEL